MSKGNTNKSPPEVSASGGFFMPILLCDSKIFLLSLLPFASVTFGNPFLKRERQQFSEKRYPLRKSIDGIRSQHVVPKHSHKIQNNTLYASGYLR